MNGNTAANFLTVMIAGLGVSPAQVGVAAAADPGGQIQIAAGQFNGVSSAAIQTQVETVAKANDPNVTLANTTIGGKSVTTATYPSSHTGPVDRLRHGRQPVPASSRPTRRSSRTR